jgi:sulfite oxidase
LNAEPKIGALISNYITPVSQQFHRNHDDIICQPETKAAYSEWKLSLRIDEDVSKEQSWKVNDAVIFTVLDLVQSSGVCKGVEHIDTTATIECAGNRREEFGETEKAEGIQWGPGVIANVFWSGEYVLVCIFCFLIDSLLRL